MKTFYPTTIEAVSTVLATQSNSFKRAIFVISLSVFFTFCSSAQVSLLNFAVTNTGSKNAITWEANISSSSTFEVQRLVSGTEYKTIAFVLSSKEDNMSAFSFNDSKMVAGRNYYRLKITDETGKVMYSPVAATGDMMGATQTAKLFPTVTAGSLSLVTTMEKDEVVSVAIVAADGRVISSNNLSLRNGSNTITLDTDYLTAGSYFVQVTNTQGNVQTLKFVKQ